VKGLFENLWKKGEPVRLLGVRFSHLVPATLQMNLFDNSLEQVQLYKAVDEIKNRFGTDALRKAQTLPDRKAPK
jgi:DNA polymerase-4